MNTVTLLEQLANNTFYSNDNQILMAKQTSDVQKAFSNSDIELMKNEFSSVGYLANGINVVEI